MRYLIVLSTFFLFGCYSFKGITIPPSVKNYYVDQVKLVALDAPADISNTFRETLRRKVREQSNLVWNETDPNIEFLCTISDFRITTEAAGEGTTVDLNKLSIAVKVEYINHKDEDDTWNRTFNYGIPFDPNVDFRSIQDDYIADIFDQITEQVINEAFAQW